MKSPSRKIKKEKIKGKKLKTAMSYYKETLKDSARKREREKKMKKRDRQWKGLGSVNGQPR
jgi:hypothetical protein